MHHFPKYFLAIRNWISDEKEDALVSLKVHSCVLEQVHWSTFAAAHMQLTWRYISCAGCVVTTWFECWWNRWNVFWHIFSGVINWLTYHIDQIYGGVNLIKSLEGFHCIRYIMPSADPNTTGCSIAMTGFQKMSMSLSWSPFSPMFCWTKRSCLFVSIGSGTVAKSVVWTQQDVGWSRWCHVPGGPFSVIKEIEQKHLVHLLLLHTVHLDAVWWLSWAGKSAQPEFLCCTYLHE